jgi:uridine phosphorylase
MKEISESDLFLNPDGSIHHLNVLTEDIASTIIIRYASMQDWQTG